MLLFLVGPFGVGALLGNSFSHTPVGMVIFRLHCTLPLLESSDFASCGPCGRICDVWSFLAAPFGRQTAFEGRMRRRQRRRLLLLLLLLLLAAAAAVVRRLVLLKVYSCMSPSVEARALKPALADKAASWRAP